MTIFVSMIRLFRTAAVVLTVLLLCSCANRLERIELVSCELGSISMTSLHSAKGTLNLEIRNPAMKFTVSDIEGTLYFEGREMAQYSADPVTIRAHRTETYPVECEITLSSSFSLGMLMSMAGSFDPSKITADISARAGMKAGPSKKIERKGVPLKKLLDKAGYGKKADAAAEI